MIELSFEKYKDKEMSKDVLCQIKNDVQDYLSNLIKDTVDFHSYKFDISCSPSNGTVTVNPADLSTALLLYKGILVDKNLNDYEDEDNFYRFDNKKFMVIPKKKLEYITIDTKLSL